MFEAPTPIGGSAFDDIMAPYGESASPTGAIGYSKESITVKPWGRGAEGAEL